MAFRSKIPFNQLTIFKVFVIEASLVMLITSLFLLIKGMVAGYSALLGGLIAFLPSVYFAVKFFRYFGAQSIATITVSLWAGEMAKFILTIGLFALVFILIKPLNEMVLFIAYCIMLMFSAMLRVLIVKKV